MLALGLGVGTIPWLLLGELCPAQVFQFVSLVLSKLLFPFSLFKLKAIFNESLFYNLLQSNNISVDLFNASISGQGFCVRSCCLRCQRRHICGRQGLSIPHCQPGTSRHLLSLRQRLLCHDDVQLLFRPGHERKIGRRTSHALRKTQNQQ
jgi:hypothetical protein